MFGRESELLALQREEAERWRQRYERAEQRIAELERQLASMIGSHGEPCPDPDARCDAVREAEAALKGGK